MTAQQAAAVRAPAGRQGTPPVMRLSVVPPNRDAPPPVMALGENSIALAVATPAALARLLTAGMATSLKHYARCSAPTSMPLTEAEQHAVRDDVPCLDQVHGDSFPVFEPREALERFWSAGRFADDRQ